MKIIHLLCGFACLGLAVLGAFLPLLPTTPFVLLAAYFFSKGSRRWHAWLMNHATFGPLIRDWQEHGALQPKTKTVAIAGMALVMAYPIGFQPIPWPFKVGMSVIFVSVSAFILSRPSRPRERAVEVRPEPSSRGIRAR
ncbi:MAG: YbaN family protein [Acidobacteriota bacterium]